MEFHLDHPSYKKLVEIVEKLRADHFYIRSSKDNEQFTIEIDSIEEFSRLCESLKRINIVFTVITSLQPVYENGKLIVFLLKETEGYYCARLQEIASYLKEASEKLIRISEL